MNVGERIPTDGNRGVRILLVAAVVASLALIGGFPAVVFVASLLVILVLHELGHYLVARRCGMQVTEFFVGFGPRLWSFRRGETEYGIKAVPAGAYVRITGMNNLEVVDPTIEHRTFRAQSYPARLAVMLAGSATHFLVAAILLVIVFSAIGRPDPNIWTVGEVVSGSAAEQMGVREGDRILSVGGVDISDFEDFGYVVRALPGRTVSVELDRDGQVTRTTGEVGERLTPAGAAAFPGVEPGDRVVAVAGRPVAGWAGLGPAVEEGKTYRLEVRRYLGAIEEVDVAVAELPDETAAVSGFFGVGADRPMTTLGPVQATRQALASLGDLGVASVGALIRIFSPSGLANFVGGAVDDGATDVRYGVVGAVEDDDSRVLSIYGVGRLGSAMFESGAYNYLWFWVYINVFFGVFNLVPVLPLDGGHIAIATYERLRSWGGRRYRADVAKLIPLTWAVVTLLIGVTLVALYRDIVDFPDFG